MLLTFVGALNKRQGHFYCWIGHKLLISFCVLILMKSILGIKSELSLPLQRKYQDIMSVMELVGVLNKC